MDLDFFSAQKLQEYTTKASENPKEAIWNDLLMISSYGFLQRNWRNQSSENLVYASTSISQAHEYYQASKHCTIKTRPLLLYYSFLNLTRAVLFLKNDVPPNSSHHGLFIKDINENILEIKVKSNDGLFKDLASYLNYDCPKYTQISFEQFIRQIPELSFDVLGYFNLEPEIHSIYIDNYISNKIEINIKPELFDCSNKFNELSKDFVIIRNNDNVNLVYNPVNEKDKNNCLINKISLIKKYFQFSPLNFEYYFNISNKPIPVELCYFGTMFILK